MKTICPKCRGEIPLEDVNVSTDLALCRSCGERYAYSRLVEEQTLIPVDLNRPPKGTWFRGDVAGFEVGSTTRSAGAFFLVPFMCVWSGLSLGGIYGTQIVKGEFNLMMSLFGIPFLLGTICLGSIAVMSVFGTILVRVRGDAGVVFTGVGPIGWRRRFEWSAVTGLGVTKHVGSRGATSDQITIEAKQRLDLGNGIKRERLDFMIGALRLMQRHYR